MKPDAPTQFARGSGRTCKPDIFIRPAHSSPNPYTSLFASSLERQGHKVREVRLSQANSPFSRGVLVLHWPNEMYQSLRLKPMVVTYLWLLHITLAKWFAGLKVVWVAHNVVPHVNVPAVPPMRWKWFTRLLDGVIALSHDSKAMVLAVHPAMTGKKWLVTTHGHYLDRACKQPALPRTPGENRIRIAALGTIRENKRIRELARAVSASNLPLDLVIRGLPDSQKLADELVQIAQDCPHIMLKFGRMTDEELEQETDAADLVVLPYSGILNSGVLVYALSRFRPVVAPRQGSLPEVRAQVGSEWIYLFDGEFGPHVLAEAVAWLRNTERAAPPDLSAQDWDVIGKDVGSFLTEVVQAG